MTAHGTPSAVTSSRAGGVRPRRGQELLQRTDGQPVRHEGESSGQSDLPDRPLRALLGVFCGSSALSTPSSPGRTTPSCPAGVPPATQPRVLTRPLSAHAHTEPPFLCQRKPNCTWGTRGPRCKCPRPRLPAAGSGREQSPDTETPVNVCWAGSPEKRGRSRCVHNRPPSWDVAGVDAPPCPRSRDLVPRMARTPAAGPGALSPPGCLSQTSDGCPRPGNAHAPRAWCHRRWVVGAGICCGMDESGCLPVRGGGRWRKRR